MLRAGKEIGMPHPLRSKCATQSIYSMLVAHNIPVIDWHLQGCLTHGNIVSETMNNDKDKYDAVGEILSYLCKGGSGGEWGWDPCGRPRGLQLVIFCKKIVNSLAISNPSCYITVVWMPVSAFSAICNAACVNVPTTLTSFIQPAHAVPGHSLRNTI